MAVAWEDFEIAQPAESTVDWQEFEPVQIEQPKKDQVKIDQLRAAQRAAARIGTLANIAGDITDVLTGAATGLTFSPSAIVGQIERGTGLNLGLEQTMRTPVVRIPEIPTTKQTPIAGQVGAGIGNAVIELANFFLSPEGVSMLGIKALPEAARKVVTASWSGQLLASSPERFNAALEAVRSGDYATAAKETTAGLGQTAMAGGLGRASLEPITVPKVPTLEENLSALAERKALAGTMPARVISPAVAGRLEQQMIAPPAGAEAPAGMVVESLPPKFSQVVGKQPITFLEPSAGVPTVPLAPKVQLETRGKVSFGAPAPVLLREAMPATDAAAASLDAPQVATLPIATAEASKQSAPAVPVREAAQGPPAETAKAVEPSTAETAGATKPITQKLKTVEQDAGLWNVYDIDGSLMGVIWDQGSKVAGEKPTAFDVLEDWYGSEPGPKLAEAKTFKEAVELVKQYKRTGDEFYEKVTGQVVPKVKEDSLFKNPYEYGSGHMYKGNIVTIAKTGLFEGDRWYQLRSQRYGTTKWVNENELISEESQQPAAPAAQPGVGGPSAISQGPEQKSNQPKYPRTDAQRQTTGPSRSDQPQGSRTEPQTEQGQTKGQVLLDQGKRRKTLKEIREQQGRQGEAGFINLSILGDAIDRLRDQISILYSQGKVKAAFTWAKDAAMNKADQYADVLGNELNNMLLRATKGTILPTRKEKLTGIIKPWSTPNELYRTALTMGVESFSEVPANHPEHGLVGRDRLISQQARLSAYAPPNPTMAKWKSKAMAGLDYAIANWTRLEPVVRRYDQQMKHHASFENMAGIDTLTRSGYVLHETDLAGESKFDFLTGKTGGENANFLKIRTFPTYVDKIIANSKPRSLDSITLAKRRIQIGQRKINNLAWIDGLRNTVDPTSGSSLITRPDVRVRADGTPQQYPPSSDYVLSKVGNQLVAVHKGYEGAFEALSNPSKFTQSLAGRIAMKTAGTTKHLVLMMDTFHLGRLAVWASILQKQPVGYKKGLVLLRYSESEIRNMARRGEIPPEYLNDLLENKRQISLAMKTGFNVSRIQDAFWQEWVQNIPVTGAFNKWLFGEFQQGAMMQAWLIEFARQKKQYDWIPEPDLARKVSRELNIRFGNLQNQGVFRSKSMQDLARLLFLAPQWNEGLIRSEIGAVGGIGKTAWDAATKKKLAISALTRSAGILFVAQLAANQLLNYVTRGHSTFENPEEGPDSKMSAYIPDIVGEGPGLFLSPVALPAEVSHLLYKRFERNKDFNDALRQYGRTRLGTVTRPLSIWVTGKDTFGRSVKNEELWKEIGTASLPIPISGGAVYHAGRQIATGERTEQFPGQFQKQALASIGLKTESAPTSVQQISSMARDFARKNNLVKGGEFPKSDYADMDRFLRTGNTVDAAKALVEIRKSHKDDAILSRYDKLPEANFTHSSDANEAKFIAGLTHEQKKTYIAARQERAELLKRFYWLWAKRGTAPPAQQ